MRGDINYSSFRYKEFHSGCPQCRPSTPCSIVKTPVRASRTACGHRAPSTPQAALEERPAPLRMTRLKSLQCHALRTFSVIDSLPRVGVSTYTGMRCIPCGVGENTYQRRASSTNAKKYCFPFTSNCNFVIPLGTKPKTLNG